MVQFVIERTSTAVPVVLAVTVVRSGGAPPGGSASSVVQRVAGAQISPSHSEPKAQVPAMTSVSKMLSPFRRSNIVVGLDTRTENGAGEFASVERVTPVFLFTSLGSSASVVAQDMPTVHVLSPIAMTQLEGLPNKAPIETTKVVDVQLLAPPSFAPSATPSKPRPSLTSAQK